MSEVWVEVTQDAIRGDRDGLVSLRSAINDALHKGRLTSYLDDEQDCEHAVEIVRVGP